MKLELDSEGECDGEAEKASEKVGFENWFLSECWACTGAMSSVLRGRAGW